MSVFSTKNFNSAAYSSYRPTYASNVYEKIYSYHESNNGKFNVALDVATGTGQVSTVLASKFDQVYATDTSSIMLENAIKKPNIIYSVSRAENLSQFSPSSIDLATTAQAVHWFETSKYFEEVARILKPNGTLAIWGYSFAILKDYPKASKMLNDFGTNDMGKYFEEGRAHLDNLYRDIKVPENLFKDVRREYYEGDDTKGESIMNAEWPIEQFTKYLKTWSSYKSYMEAHPGAEDPVDRLVTEIMDAEGIKHGEIMRVVWPTVLILAEKK